MKNKILITSIILSVMVMALPSIAQEKKSEEKQNEKLRLGIKGSFNITTLNSIKNSSVDNFSIGFSAGLFAKLPLVRKMSVQPELYVATKGATVSYSDPLLKGSAKYNLNYIELPIFLVYNVTPNFNFHAGPYAGVLISGNAKNETAAHVFDFENNINKDNYNRIDAGIAAGVGMDIGAIGIGLRYYQGLTRIGKEKAYTGFNYTFPDAVNGVFSAYINISIN
jgi:hypothetical protein